MLIDSAFPAVGVGKLHIREIKFSGLPDVFHQEDPSQSASSEQASARPCTSFLFGVAGDCEGFEGLDLVVRNKPLPAGKVQSIALLMQTSA